MTARRLAWGQAPWPCSAATIARKFQRNPLISWIPRPEIRSRRKPRAARTRSEAALARPRPPFPWDRHAAKARRKTGVFNAPRRLATTSRRLAWGQAPWPCSAATIARKFQRNPLISWIPRPEIRSRRKPRAAWTRSEAALARPRPPFPWDRHAAKARRKTGVFNAPRRLATTSRRLAWGQAPWPCSAATIARKFQRNPLISWIPRPEIRSRRKPRAARTRSEAALARPRPPFPWDRHAAKARRKTGVFNAPRRLATTSRRLAWSQAPWPCSGATIARKFQRNPLISWIPRPGIRSRRKPRAARTRSEAALARPRPPFPWDRHAASAASAAPRRLRPAYLDASAAIRSRAPPTPAASARE